jgi:tRNA dimethylallyltransferase
MAELRPLIVVLGPTGSGKSDLALEMAAAFDGEIVNCDSVQLYRYMNIGAAKTPPEERRGVPHHLIDILDPDQVFTAGDYMRCARPVLIDIGGRERLPIISGGTGFYLRALLNGLSSGPMRDEDLRGRLSLRSGARLHRLLQRFDPLAAGRIHANDKQKLVRALEICLLSRQPLSSLQERPAEALAGFRILKIGLDPPRAALASRLDQRCVRMFQEGLVEETRTILSKGFPPDSKALESIGYRQAVSYLQGVLTVKDAIRLTQAATRQYAKRQRTWFRREPGVHWIAGFGNHLETLQAAKRLAGEYLKIIPP